jgi:hypothetical protein
MQILRNNPVTNDDKQAASGRSAHAFEYAVKLKRSAVDIKCGTYGHINSSAAHIADTGDIFI